MATSFEEELERSGRLAYTNVGISMLPLLREKRDVMRIERMLEIECDLAHNTRRRSMKEY